MWFFAMSILVQAATPILGVDRWDHYQDKLSQGRIGLVVNQASVTSSGEHTIDFLLRHNVNIKKLFALEHGIRGEGGAGENLPDSRDEKTGLPIVSLYGPHKKPTPDMLADLDLIVYDIQDVGVRFYTYISSLGLIMEAAAENKVGLLILDRPNPNGDYVSGPILKPENKSFVGAFPIPLVHGLTVGELSLMIHAKRWQKTQGLKLQVVSAENYKHSDLFIPSVWPSSGLKNPKAIRAYPSIALFEPTVINYGGGTDYPFLQFCYPNPKMGEYSYIPLRQNPKQEPRHEGKVCYGEKFFDLEYDQVPKFTTDYFTHALKNSEVPGGIVTDRKFFRLLVGDTKVADSLLQGKSWAQISKELKPELSRFQRDRKKFLLYPEN